jgi:hypothetical protein
MTALAEQHASTIQTNLKPLTEAFDEFITDLKFLFAIGAYSPPTQFEKELLKTDIGEYGWYRDIAVPLDLPVLWMDGAIVFVKHPTEAEVVRIKIDLGQVEQPTPQDETDKCKPGFWYSRIDRYKDLMICASASKRLSIACGK